MVKLKYRAYCPFCMEEHLGEFKLTYRKDGKRFNLRKRNTNLHTCRKCGKNFLVEVDSLGNIISYPTKEAIKEGIFPWERIVDGKKIKVAAK